MGIKDALGKVDRAQRRHVALAVPIATVKKFSEDKSSQLASMIAFWAFFSLFPLMLAVVTLLSFVLPDSTKASVLEQIGGYFPLVDVSAIEGLQGNWPALVVGVLTALWSGSAVVRTTQDAFNSVWEVPQVERPNIVGSVRRSFLAMATIGVGLIASTFAVGFVTGDDPPIDLGPLGRIVGFTAAILVDVGLFVLAFRMLTDRDLTVRDVLPGAVFAGVMFWILQSVSSLIITRYLAGAQATYGTFATVITILWWFYLQAQLTLLGAQLNVVLKRQYYPRGLIDTPTTEADHRLLEDIAGERRLNERQEVESRIVDGERAKESDGCGTDNDASDLELAESDLRQPDSGARRQR